MKAKARIKKSNGETKVTIEMTFEDWLALRDLAVHVKWRNFSEKGYTQENYRIANEICKLETEYKTIQ